MLSAQAGPTVLSGEVSAGPKSLQLSSSCRCAYLGNGAMSKIQRSDLMKVGSARPCQCLLLRPALVPSQESIPGFTAGRACAAVSDNGSHGTSGPASHLLETPSGVAWKGSSPVSIVTASFDFTPSTFNFSIFYLSIHPPPAPP